MNKKKNRLHIKLIRRMIQIAAFLLFPGLFISVFSAVGSVYRSIVNDTFSLIELAQPLIILVGVMLITMLWGRFFCGFLCSFGSMGDFFWFLSTKLFPNKPRVAEKAGRVLKLLKYVVLSLIVIFVWTFSFQIDSTTNPWTIFGMYASVSGWSSLGYLLSLGAFFLLLIIVGSMLIERFFCRYFCPLGAVYALLSRFRVFRIKKPRSNCGSCKLCARTCAMGIPLDQYDVISSGECIDCFACMEHCPRNNITANPAPSIATAMTVVAMTGLYYAGSLIPQSSEELGMSITALADSAIKGQYVDGIYTGSASGYKGVTTVQVTVENGSISEISVLSTDDDYEFFNKAKNTILNEILSAQNTNVDVVTGATFSSKAIINAVNQALGLSGEDGISEQNSENEQDVFESTERNEASTETKISSEIQGVSDGIYSGTGSGFRGDTTVSVTVNSGKITQINVESYEDDAPYFNAAKKDVIASIINQQSIDVDVVTGATFSSNSILEAVSNALGISFENPNDTAVQYGHHGGGKQGLDNTKIS